MPTGKSVLGITLIALACAGSSPLTQQLPPAFRTGVDAVRLDLRVVSADGSFVGDVTKDDLRVIEDGVQQTISAFAKIELSPAAAPSAAGPSTDVSSNTTFRNGRVYLLVLDDLSVHPQREVTVRQLARRFIEQYTTPYDRVAIATPSGIGSGNSQDFTNDRAHLFAAIDRFKGRLIPEAVTTDFPGLVAAQVASAGERPPTTNFPQQVVPLEWLLSSVEFLGTVPDRRKALVLISEGVLAHSIDVNVGATHLEIQSAASRANVAIYSVDAAGMPTAPSGAVKPVVVATDDSQSAERQDLRAGLIRLADETGGAFVVGSNAFDALFKRVVDDSSSYYVLGFTSTHPQTKKLRKLEVRVNRPGLKVQVRQSHGSPSSRVARRSAPPAGLPAALGAAFQSAVPLTDVELAVSSVPRRGSGNTASVAVIVEAGGQQPLDLFIGAADSSGKLQGTKRGALKPTATNAAAAMMQATARFDLKPGRYHLRVAAMQEGTEASGSVLHDVVVPDFSKEDLSISGVTLIDQQRGNTPTTRRTFAQSESIDVAAEVYWKRGMTQTVTIATTVTNIENGEEVYRQEGAVEPADRPQQGVDFGVTLNPQRWQPGRYQLTVAARTTSGKALSAQQSVPLVVTAAP
jgi:VWFA-related protein